jgi:hypothetical protein
MGHRNVTTTTRRDERAHPVIRDAIDKGHVTSGEPYPVNGFAGHDAANQGRLSVRRAGEHLGVSIACWVCDSDGTPCYKSCKDPDAPHGIRIRLFSKKSARAKVVEDSGGDPANLKYNPFRRVSGPILDDHGNRIGA